MITIDKAMTQPFSLPAFANTLLRGIAELQGGQAKEKERSPNAKENLDVADKAVVAKSPSGR
jgi:hypothetical protein